MIFALVECLGKRVALEIEREKVFLTEDDDNASWTQFIILLRS